jgi:hypothetical protein
MKRFKVNIPEQETQNWYIKKVYGDSSSIYTNAIDRPCSGKAEPVDEYTFLCQKNPNSIVMADTYHEYREHGHLWENASGDVLIGGLGLGLVNNFLIKCERVNSVTIIENSQEVIDIVWPYCEKNDKFSLIKANIEEYNPGMCWNYAWFDTYIQGNPLTHAEYKNKIINRYCDFCESINFWESIP